MAFAAPDVASIDRIGLGLARVLDAEPFIDFAFGHGSFFEGLPHHDVDVAIGMVPGCASPLADLWRLAARAEVLVERPVDIHVLPAGYSPFAASAMSGRLLLARDPHAVMDLAGLYQRMRADFRPIQDRCLLELSSRRPAPSRPR